ncbi:MAG TPA: uroporphyrinogen-III synthase [Rhizomicrobium sp.]
MRILVTRPQEDGAETAAALARMGHQTVLAPLLSAHFHNGPEPALDDVQAILATSANGVRALARRTVRRDLPVFAVGPQTADEARKAGFHDVKSANGDARALAVAVAGWALPENGVLLHVCGEEAPGALANDLAGHGFFVRRCVLYRIDAAASLPPDVGAALADGALDAIIFFSPRSARIFRELTGDLPMQRLIAICISQATADALAPQSFAQVRVAPTPNQAAVLALVE